MTTFSFKTIGCRLNQAETAAMRGAIAAAGGQIVGFGDPCDVCIIHGCAVTARAEKNTWRTARAVKRSGLCKQAVVAGCPAELAKHQPGRSCADLLLCQREKLDISALCARFKLVVPDASKPAPPVFDTTRALVRVQDGCDFFCAYCIVPYTRGALQSRPLPEIIAEIRLLCDAGRNEAVITGANIGCYNWRGQNLAQLIGAILQQTDIPRLRLSSIELSTAEREVIDRMADSPRLCRFLHLPLQSGSDAILKAMRRRYTRSQYMATVEYAVQKLGMPGLGADILTGFPGETDADFQATLSLINELPFGSLHIFTYSPRPGTPGAAMPGQIPEHVKKERAAQLRELSHVKRAAYARKWVGRVVEALIEKTPDSQLDAAGFTGEYLPVRIAPGPAGKIPVNTIVRCIPHDTDADTLLA